VNLSLLIFDRVTSVCYSLVYEWLVKSRVFQLNLDHFANRWRDATFRKRIQEHKHYPYFLCTWLPNYLEERSKDFTDGGKRNENACTQDDSTTLPAIVLQWVSETWPEARKEYDSKLSTHLKDSAEKHVRDIISAAIPLPPPPELQTQSNAQVASKSVQNPMGRTAAVSYCSVSTANKLMHLDARCTPLDQV